MKIFDIIATQRLLTPIWETSTTPLMLYHLTPARNLPSIMRDGLVPQIGARAKLIGEPTPGIYLFNSVEEAEDAMMNWFGDQFDEEIPIALLAVTVPEGATEIAGAGYERILTSPVLPTEIKVLNPDL